MKPKNIANEILDFGLEYALKHQDDPRKRVKAYRKAATEFLDIAAQMELDVN